MGWDIAALFWDRVNHEPTPLPVVIIVVNLLWSLSLGIVLLVHDWCNHHWWFKLWVWTNTPIMLVLLLVVNYWGTKWIKSVIFRAQHLR
jgi:hypothetical protein